VEQKTLFAFLQESYVLRQIVTETAAGVERVNKKGKAPFFVVIMKADICWLLMIKK